MDGWMDGWLDGWVDGMPHKGEMFAHQLNCLHPGDCRGRVTCNYVSSSVFTSTCHAEPSGLSGLFAVHTN